MYSKTKTTDIGVYMAASYAADGHTLLKKLNKMAKGRSRDWFRNREKLIKNLVSKRIMYWINYE